MLVSIAQNEFGIAAPCLFVQLSVSAAWWLLACLHCSESVWYSALLVSIVLNNYGLYICSAQNERVMAKTVELSICLFVCLFVCLFCFVLFCSG